MMISPTQSSQYVSPLTPPSSAIQTDATSPTTTPSSSTQMSGFGAFMSKLQGLEQSNPAQAKAQLSAIANKLSTQAQQVGGTRGQQLSALADKFSTAAQTGNLSGLQSTAVQSGQSAAGAHHHGGHGHKKLSSYQQNSDSSSDLVDTLNNAVSTSAAA
jgi:hypothetical protein